MTSEELIAEADALDREADSIFSKIEMAHLAEGPNGFGEYALTPAGFHGEAQKAGNLTRRARALRAEAAEIAAPLPTSAAPEVPFAPLRNTLGAAEDYEAVALRILASDALPRDKGVEHAPKRIKRGDGPADVEDIARRILNA